MTKKERERNEALEHLRPLLPPGTTIHTIVRHVASSGMSRRIDLYLLGPESKLYLSGWVAAALDYRRHSDGSLRVPGYGMDMGFHLVHNLSMALYPDGFTCLGKTDEPRRFCPSNDHSNGDRDYTPHHHSSGAYALRQEWI